MEFGSKVFRENFHKRIGPGGKGVVPQSPLLTALGYFQSRRLIVQQPPCFLYGFVGAAISDHLVFGLEIFGKVGFPVGQ